MTARKAEITIIVVLVIGITIAHYATPPHLPLMHDLYRRLYYVPIFWAAIRYGLKGGLMTSLAVSVLYLPHVFHRWGTIEMQTTDAIFEIILYNAIAGITGVLSESERSIRARLEQADKELMRSSHMKTLGEIAAGMAHEIRNPLASLRGGIELLGKKTASGEERAEVSGILGPELERIDRVIQDFLSYARPGELMMEEIDLGETAREVHALLERGEAAGVTIGLSIEAMAPRVRGDAQQIRSVVMNLALNAMAAVGEGGKVDISVGRDGEDAVIRVRDDGKGIDPADADRVFVPFYTTREKGLGLGLSIVKRIVENHGGSIRFESSLGNGTVFEVRLDGVT